MANHNKILSIILTAHNCEKYLDETLKSLDSALKHAVHDVEVILVCDSSTDKSAEILLAYTKRNNNAQYFEVDFKNIGKVRNFGVSKCSGDYITMLDGDDRLLDGAYEDIVRYLDSSKPDLLLTKLNEVYNENYTAFGWGEIKVTKWSQHLAIKKYLIHKDIQAHFIGQFIKSDILKKHLFPEFHCYEDAWTFPSILTNSLSIHYLSRGPYLYVKRSGSLSSSIDYEKIKILIGAIENMDKTFGKKYSHLSACHWINVQHKYSTIITDDDVREKIQTRLNGINIVPFLFDFNVRMSFKKKFIKKK